MYNLFFTVLAAIMKCMLDIPVINIMNANNINSKPPFHTSIFTFIKLDFEGNNIANFHLKC